MSVPTDTGTTLRDRVRDDPRPALVWIAGAAFLLALEAGAAFHFAATLLADAVAALPVTAGPGFAGTLSEHAAGIPTLLSRDVVPNGGYWNGSGYVGTFLGLSPVMSWLLRVALVYLYSFALLGWAWVGYVWFRRHYRVADWTPRDDVVNRLRGHKWGIFGLVVVFMFVVLAAFAPALGPSTVQQNLQNPYDHTIQYWNAETDSVEEVNVGVANSNARSVGTDNNVGVWSYDDYGRFHPFGTLPSGKDLFTFLAAGARISLVIGVLSVGLSALFATTFALLSAYYKDKVDLSLVLVSDSVSALPQLLLLIMLTVVLADTWIGNLYSGAFVLALIFAGTTWPYMWRSLRGPALQVSEAEWVDAAKSFGQTPGRIMRKHMFPYIVGYLLIYGSMTLGGAIISIAGLSFLGLGVNPPTPEWGRAVNAGQAYVGGPSWHISLIPGVLITLVVTGFNALGDGIRDAIDPESDSATDGAAGRGGGA
ncbi:ABC transporter permease [Halorarum halophilum]|uniref:ABC transporter permease n=1 Tax=Halorarum halophilum TaxID=2743090 RepID=A0A7D5KKV9_9EURY|nr:ABC transporter permease [Halobaculum halophilum]QLG26975.1 ABC transporter permease [Halobaculum halophilum]